MNEIIIACEMVQDELELAMEHTGIRPPVVWLEKGLHEFPKRLCQTLQEEIDRQAQSHDLILLALSYCGGALDGIGSKTATVAAPRFDDCIRMLLSLEPGMRNEADCRSLYFTRQWLTSERHIGKDYARDCAKYGHAKAARIYKSILVNYRYLRMVDTGAYVLSECEPGVRQTAKELELDYAEQPGTIRVLEKLLRQEFDQEFCVKQPGEAFNQVDFLDL